MIEVKCTGKKRDKHNNIIAYKLVDRQGTVKILKPQEVKQLIREKKINIVNLTLTSDNRLVDGAKPTPVKVSVKKPSPAPTQPKVEQPVAKLFSELTKVEQDWVVNDICTGRGHNCSLYENLNTLFNDMLMEDYHCWRTEQGKELDTKYGISVDTDKLYWQSNSQGPYPEWDLSDVFGTQSFNIDGFDFDVEVYGKSTDVKAYITVSHSDIPECDYEYDSTDGDYAFPVECTVENDTDLLEEGVVVRFGTEIGYIGAVNTTAFVYAFASMYQKVCPDVANAVQKAKEVQKYLLDTRAVVKDGRTYTVLKTDNGALQICPVSDILTTHIEMDFKGTKYTGDIHNIAFEYALDRLLHEFPQVNTAIQDWCNSSESFDFDFDGTIADTLHEFVDYIRHQFNAFQRGDDDFDTFDICIPVEAGLNLELFLQRDSEEVYYTADFVPMSVKQALKERLETMQKFIDNLWEQVGDVCRAYMTEEWVRDMLEGNDYTFIKYKDVIKWENE